MSSEGVVLIPSTLLLFMKFDDRGNIVFVVCKVVDDVLVVGSRSAVTEFH